MRFLAFVVAAFCATSALADEVWDSDIGAFVYESDEADGSAVLSFRNFDGYQATLVIPDLAGNYDNRGLHDAFWIGQGPGFCLGSLSYDGKSGNQWGGALLQFDTSSYPTSFTLLMGDCLHPFHTSVRAIIR